MADIKLFRTDSGNVEEVPAETLAVERSLQKQIEEHLPEYLGVRFLASEYSTGRAHGGRIDTLGIDSNGCPVIIEYKRGQTANVINQGLFYLDWLLDHRGDFAGLVSERLGADCAAIIDWSSPRLICIAGGFSKYDEHAVQLISRNVELLRYRKHGELLLLERVNQGIARSVQTVSLEAQERKRRLVPFDELLGSCTPEARARYEALRDFTLALAPDVWMKQRKYAVDFRIGTPKDWENIVNVELQQDGGLLLWIDSDVITVKSHADLESAKPALDRSYQACKALSQKGTR